jgi:hypothetical protein
MSEDQGSAPVFHVGQKVVCVDDRCHGRYLPPGFSSVPNLHGLTAGRVYTVRRVGYIAGSDVFSIWLQEIIRPTKLIFGITHDELPFAAARFRPLVERKTDISIFTAMLNSSRKKVPA